MSPTSLRKQIFVSPDTHRKAKLLAALLDKQLNEAVDLALTKMLQEVQAPPTPAPTPKPKKKK